jgi:hypothetical protein
MINLRLPAARITVLSISGMVLLLAAAPARACDACMVRLIDESIEPPTEYSPDFAETATVEPSPPVSHPRGPVVPAARQPAGVLSGKIVFTNGGHGWTWDPDYWRVQRPVTQEMNEDMGNLDQMNFFAAWCFNAGAVVVPMRPLGQQNNAVVLDNDDPEVTYTGTWANSTSTLFFGSAGDVPYRYAALANAETATATYTPNLPARGHYPVYTWVRHGSDRTPQLYRIRHTGGESQVRIPHHMVGNGWVYLGEYYFDAGVNAARGSVVVSNLRSSEQGEYTFADAIRFGNGMGTVNRGTGVSTYPCEEENCRYWFQANLGQGQSSTLYDGGGADESDSWSAPSKMSAEMNREAAGSFFDRIHISFHSNAGGGRGTLALITGDPTPNQTRLAQICGREVNDDLVALGSPPLEVPWQNRSNITYTGGYSEIDGSLFSYEMDATIIEVAFHDSPDDARLMRDPKARSAVGRAAMHAAVKYMNEFAGGPLNFPPEAPTGLRAQAGTNGAIVLSWTQPVSAGGSGMPTGYVIYRSTNGYGFGVPATVGNVTTFTLTGLALDTDHYFRVAAINAGGESFPSEVAGCRPASTGARQVLFVNGFDRFDRTLNLRQDLTRQGYAPPDATGAAERVLPRRNNSSDYIVPHGKALSAAGYAFDSCQNEHTASGAVRLTDYPLVVWASGQESVSDESFSASEQSAVAAFRAGGGSLFVSGSEIAWDLDRASGPTAADRVFFNAQLKADLASDANDDSNSYTLNPVAGGLFAGMAAIAFDDGTRGVYPVQSPDVLTPMGGAVASLTFAGVASGAAALVYDGAAGGGRLVYLGLPFETISGSAVRAELMRRALEFLDAPEILVAAGLEWKYFDTGALPGANWMTTGFNDSAWPSGAAQLGFGENDEATALINDPSRITTWFRRSFNMTDARKFNALRLRLLRDDGAIVWLNGHELARSNLPDTGAILPSTQALAAVGGLDENVFLTLPADVRLLRRGSNTLAVELHQAGTASSDLSFDLELGGAETPPPVLVPAGAVWRYRDTGIAPPGNWNTSAYPDDSWPSGPARLGYGGDGEITMLSNGGNAGNVHPVTWLRHVFAVTDAAAFDALKVDLQRDDGVVLWLNGVEILRDNLRSGPLTATTYATVTMGGADEQAWRSFHLSSSELVTGTNVLAAQIHQAGPASGDIGFDLRLSGLAQAPGTFAEWRTVHFGSDATNGTVAGDLADPDNDSQVNLLEYAFGTRPDATRTSACPAVTVEGEHLVFRFQRSSLASDLTFTIQAADSLAGPWTVLAGSTAGNPVEAMAPGVSVTEPATGALRQVEVRDASAITDPARPHRFLRLAVSR